MGGSDNRARKVSALLPRGRALWVPIDHGVSSWPVEGLEDTEVLLSILKENGCDAVIAHKGIISDSSHDSSPPFLMHLSASTVHGGKHASDKVLVASAEEAVSRGAIGVSVQVNLGDKFEYRMLERLGKVAEECHRLQIPLLGMIYPRGSGLQIEGDSTKGAAHAARLAWELGCDAVKTSWPGSKEAFAEVVNAAPIPVLIAGGESSGNFSEILEIVAEALSVGGAGVCMGRQIFANADPSACVKALYELIHEGVSFEEAQKNIL